MTRRRILVVLSAVVLTLFGMVVIVAYVNTAERRALAGTELARVLVATEDIDANTPASDLQEVVTLEEYPARLRQPDAVLRLDDLQGQVTVAPIRAGEQIVQRQFGDRSDAAPSGSGEVEPGNELVSIALEPQRAAGGRLAAGDLVSVVVSTSTAEVLDEEDTSQTTTVDNTTGTVLSNVRVAAVSGGVSDDSGQAADTVIVSLEVDESAAEEIVYGMEYGSVWLTLNGEEVDSPDVGTTRAGNLYPGSGGGG